MLAIAYETAVVAKRAHLAEVVGNNALILHYQIPECAVYRKDSGDPENRKGGIWRENAG